MSELSTGVDQPYGRLDILDPQGKQTQALDLRDTQEGPRMVAPRVRASHGFLYQRPGVESRDDIEPITDPEPTPESLGTWRERAEQRFASPEDRFDWGGRPSETEGMRIIQVHELPDLPPEEVEIPVDHDETLRSLLGTDYPTALESGVLSKFYMDKDYNGPLHVLVGELKEVGADTVLRGLHHASSAKEFWSKKPINDDEEPRDVRVYTDGSERLYPADPYRASLVTVGDMPKTMGMYVGRGRRATVVAPSTMFPEWFDAYTALKNTTLALENSDPDREVSQTVARNGVEQTRRVSWGAAPGLDGKSEIMYKLVTVDGKIISARPVLEESTPTFIDEKNMMRLLLNGAGYIGYTRGQ